MHQWVLYFMITKQNIYQLKPYFLIKHKFSLPLSFFLFALNKMGVKRAFQNLMISMLENKWPGLKDVVEVLGKNPANLAKCYYSKLQSIIEVIFGRENRTKCC